MLLGERAIYICLKQQEIELAQQAHSLYKQCERNSSTNITIQAD